ncbi:hypothetical protein GQ54DRAFT_318719 [Martensiomyces pterosporus]|nr:hypothetical protein GQ54DRAFT_318719 [Martensiomyces pterosporus]
MAVIAKPKILCLHGFAENAELFKIKSRNFRKVVGDSADLVYVDAPIDVGALRLTSEELAAADPKNDFSNFAWWWVKNGKNPELRGIEECLTVIGNVLNEQGPFDGIVGFSQGAAFAVVISALLDGCKGSLSFGVEVSHPPIKFLLLAGAYRLDMPQYQYLYEKRFSMPSMHMMGTYDTVIEISRSQKLLECFDSPVVFEFVGGHFMPQTPKCAREMRAFLTRFIPLLPQE